MMFNWLPENEQANVPPFAHTMIGVGAVVVNEKDQILAVSEKNALIPNSWKLPGGYAEPSEWVMLLISNPLLILIPSLSRGESCRVCCQRGL